MFLNGKKIGIWGFGVVGKSALRYLSPYNVCIGITDKNSLSADDKNLFSTHRHLIWYDYAHLNHFLADHDSIIPSPGIDLRPYKTYTHKWLAEIDIFTTSFKKPIIAVTGSAGKTTIVHLLSQLITNAGHSVATGGNIGIGMLDILTTAQSVDYAVLELSSFQLALSSHCTPDLAIITNIFPNHLDRHGTLSDYMQAKLAILANQKIDQHALVPYALIAVLKERKLFERPLAFFALHRADVTALLPLHTLFFIENNAIIQWHAGKETILYSCNNLPPHSFAHNWLIIVAALTTLHIPLDYAFKNSSLLTMPAHRLELVTTKNGITFYNDSKSTLPAATLAALSNLQSKSIILLLGGISKGIDRQPFIQQLPVNVKQVLCFGVEAFELKKFCGRAHKDAHAYNTLEEAFSAAIKNAQAGDVILFSPAGASYDLFKNYEQRGDYFKKLVAHNF